LREFFPSPVVNASVLLNLVSAFSPFYGQFFTPSQGASSSHLNVGLSPGGEMVTLFNLSSPVSSSLFKDGTDEPRVRSIIDLFLKFFLSSSREVQIESLVIFLLFFLPYPLLAYPGGRPATWQSFYESFSSCRGK